METAANSDTQDADKNDAVVVAVTRDGRVYTNVQKNKIRNQISCKVALVGRESTEFLFYTRSITISIP